MANRPLRGLFTLLFVALAAPALASACANGTTSSGTTSGTSGGGDGGGTARDASGTDDAEDPYTTEDTGAPGTDAGTNKDGATTSDANGTDTGVTDTGVADTFVADTYVPPDTGTCATVPPNNLCGLSPQCGCNANQTCDVTNATTGATSCVAAGALPKGAFCVQTSACTAGLTCQFDACRPYCKTANDCGTGSTCFAPEDTNGNTTPNLNVCTIKCDPRSSSTACGTNSCMWFSADGVTDCRQGGSSGEYGSCTSTYDCRAGFACATHPLFGTECERWCRVGFSSDCSSADVCTDVYGANAPVINGVKYGLCQ